MPQLKGQWSSEWSYRCSRSAAVCVSVVKYANLIRFCQFCAYIVTYLRKKQTFGISSVRVLVCISLGHRVSVIVVEKPFVSGTFHQYRWRTGERSTPRPQLTGSLGHRTSPSLELFRCEFAASCKQAWLSMVRCITRSTRTRLLC